MLNAIIFTFSGITPESIDAAVQRRDFPRLCAVLMRHIQTVQAVTRNP